jgi:Zn ribbon nucleic-acid-binding protein
MKKLIKKLIKWFKLKCPNCKTILKKEVWTDNTVELTCTTCKYHKTYNDSYP